MSFPFRAAVLALVCFLPCSHGQEPVRMARTPDISPDSKQVAFSYLGDIWTVDAGGGVARALTHHLAHDYYPRFSPDGKWIAFASNRHGSYDVFVVSARGGKPRRLTFDSSTDVPAGWTPDSKNILFVSNRSTDYPGQYDLYSVPVEGGREFRVTSTEAREGAYSPKGDLIAYSRGPGEWYRKGYRGSSNNDIWICDASGANHRQFTNFPGQDNSPVWSADGSTLYFVSEVFGTPANLVKQKVNGGDKPTLVTADANGKPFHKVDAVRQARISTNGETIVYECGADLWLVSTKPGSQPRQLNIEINADDKTNPERIVTYTQRATEFALSRDEQFLAFVVHGEIFMRPVLTPSTQTRRLTNSPANDHGIAWAPDSSKMVFISDRNGHDDLYLLEADDPDHPRFTDAHKFKTKQLTNSPDAASGAMFAPDGSRVTFLRNSRLWSMKPDGTEQKILVDTPRIVDYEWSPDGKWIVFSRADGSFASELYIVPAAGGEAKNVTRFATENVGVTWSGDGQRLAFLSHRRGLTTLYVQSLQKESAPGVPKSSDIDFEDIHHRVKTVTNMEIREGAINANGSHVAFAATSQGSDDLWVANVATGSVMRVTTNNLRPTQITWSHRSPQLLYFRDRDGQLYLGNIPPVGSGSAGTASGSSSTALLPFRAKMTINDPEMFLEMFDQSWRYLAENFYDRAFHGVDWKQVRERYRPLVKHVALKEDLFTLLYMMLGELNASHLGVAGSGIPPEEMTADLGLIFDDAYRGRGLKIVDVLKRGPADKRGLSLKAGEFVLAIDGTEITPTTNITKLLNDKVNEAITLHISANAAADLSDKMAVRRVEVRGASRDLTSQLMYERWTERNAKRVAELSGGKLGYIHIPSMNEAGLDRFVRSLYSDNFDKEAIVLDVRFNGGGFTHDQVLNYLGSKAHTIFRFRDGGEGQVIRAFDRKWTKPVALVINNRCFSDAEIFPHAFRKLGLGKLVGEATGGHVIGTTSFNLIDGSQFRIPRVGVYTIDGKNMDREGVKPDIEVIAQPDQLLKGIDQQLDRAVEVLKSTATSSLK
jgi:tricorn protease